MRSEEAALPSGTAPRRYYCVAGITIEVESELPFSESTFGDRFVSFRVDGPGDDNVSVRHHFGLPRFSVAEFPQLLYHAVPWSIRRGGGRLAYVGIQPGQDDVPAYNLAILDEDHRRGEFFHPSPDVFLRGDLESVTMLPTDQILLAPLLADRRGVILHCAGVIVDAQAFAFVGESSAGKSTTVKMLQGSAEILCDDRNVVRRWPEGFRLHGTWSHGEIPTVSSSSAPLRAILLLEKAPVNRLTRVRDARALLAALLPRLVRALALTDWWDKTLPLVEEIIEKVPVYRMEFDLSGEIVHHLRREFDLDGKRVGG